MTLALTLLAPSRLWVLAVVAGLAVAYVVLQRRRRHQAIPHPDLALLAAVAPRWAGWRRHLTAVVLFVGAAALALGLARPARSEEVAREEAVVVLAIDVSRSMNATDVKPNRFVAAVAAAKEFVSRAREGHRIGVVAFDGTSRTVAAPTTDHEAVLSAIDNLQRGTGTAAGEAVFTALDDIRSAFADDGAIVTTDRPYAAVVLLSDGVTVSGRPMEQAGAAASDLNVPVFTVAYGVPGADPASRTAVAREQLAALADGTGGRTYTAETASELRDVYGEIGTRIARTTENVELTLPLAAIAAAAVALALMASMVWSPRLA